MFLFSAALAFTCDNPGPYWEPPPSGVLPANGEVVFTTSQGEVPTSASFRPLDSTRAVVDATVEVRSSTTYALIPASPLETGVTYHTNGPWVADAPFELGATEDVDAPSPPSVHVEHIVGIDDWNQQDQDYLYIGGENVEARFEVEFALLDGTTHVVSGFDRVLLGEWACGTDPYPFAPTDVDAVRSRNVDWAGNTSDWVDVPFTPYTTAPAAGCDSSRGAILGVFEWGRRR